jgi:hypothetical protein
MRDRLIELVMNTPKLPITVGGRTNGKTYQTAGNIADHLLENGVIVPPCKVGDKVYQTDGIRIYPSVITELVIGEKNIIFYTNYGNNIAFDETAIGDSIYLTKEEAEKALKGGEQG